MPARRRTSAPALATQFGELAFAAPQVIAHRLTRFAQTAAAPSAADKREWHRMSSEKVAAFNESWLAIGMELWRIQQRQAMAMMTAAFAFPWTGKPWSYSQAASRRDAVALAGRAMTPVHRRAVANAKRLGSARSRA